MLNNSTRETYYHFIREVCTDPFSALPAFCDWLDENGIRSQRWREALALLDKAEYWRKSKLIKEGNTFFYTVEFKTKKKRVMISFCNYRISVHIVTINYNDADMLLLGCFQPVVRN